MNAYTSDTEFDSFGLVFTHHAVTHAHCYMFFKKIHSKSTVYSSKVSVVISSFSRSPNPCLMCVTGCGMFGR